MSALGVWASRVRRGAVDPVRALVHPLWIASLVILVVNDHALKGAGVLPGWLTGKLSDVSGLVVAPPLLAALLRTRTRGRLLFAHVAVGLVYAALEVSPGLTALWRIPFDALGIGWQSFHDPTDLLALPMLAVSWWIAARPPVEVAGPRLAERSLAVAGLVACMATSQEQFGPNIQPPPCVDCDGDGWPAPLDCNDNDVNQSPDLGCPDPTVEQFCDDGIDDDGDGSTDCHDPDCATACAAVEAECAAATPAQGSLTGTTLGKLGSMEGSCIGADAAEMVFSFTPSAALGILELDVPAGHGVYVRRQCDVPSTEIACVDADEGAEGPLQILVGPEPIVIVVDAKNAFEASDFSVPMSYQPLVCGDGIVVGPEECDDGNQTDGDGCSSLCASELPFVCNTWQPLVLGTNPGDTTSAQSLFAGACGGDGPERRYGFVAPSDGTLSLSLGSTGDLALHARTTCVDATTEIGCADAADVGGTETLDVALTTGQAIMVFVDSSSSEADAAPFILTASFAP